MEKIYNSESEKMLATTRVEKLFARYAVPGVISLVFLSLQSVLDGIIVGNFIGPDALAGVSLIVPVYSLVSSLSIIIGIGSQAQMSIGLGACDYVKVKSVMKTGILSIISVSILSTILISFFAPELSVFLGADESLIDYSVGYIYGIIPFAIVISCMYFFDYILKSLGHPRFAMILMIIMTFVNIILSIVFVAFLELGTFGVGIATGISSLIGVIMAVIVVAKQMRKIRDLTTGKGNFSWNLLGRIFYNGSSEGVSEIAMAITLFLYNITLMKYAGKEGVAAFSVINYLIFIGASIFLGISNGVISIISYNYGAGLWDRIKKTVYISVKTNFIIGIFFLILLLCFGEIVISLFLDDRESNIINLAAGGAKIIGLGFLLNGFNIFAASFFTAIDNPKYSLLIAALRGLVFIIAGIVILPPLFDVNGIWMTMPIAELLTALIAIYLLQKEMKKLLQGT